MILEKNTPLPPLYLGSNEQYVIHTRYYNLVKQMQFDIADRWGTRKIVANITVEQAKQLIERLGDFITTEMAGL